MINSLFNPSTSTLKPWWNHGNGCWESSAGTWTKLVAPHRVCFLRLLPPVTVARQWTDASSCMCLYGTNSLWKLFKGGLSGLEAACSKGLDNKLLLLACSFSYCVSVSSNFSSANKWNLCPERRPSPGIHKKKEKKSVCRRKIWLLLCWPDVDGLILKISNGQIWPTVESPDGNKSCMLSGLSSLPLGGIHPSLHLDAGAILGPRSRSKPAQIFLCSINGIHLHILITRH